MQLILKGMDYHLATATVGPVRSYPHGRSTLHDESPVSAGPAPLACARQLPLPRPTAHPTIVTAFRFVVPAACGTRVQSNPASRVGVRETAIRVVHAPHDFDHVWGCFVLIHASWNVFGAVTAVHGRLCGPLALLPLPGVARLSPSTPLPIKRWGTKRVRRCISTL